MPATSRSGESGRRRSSTGWPGSPSKSISSQVFGVRSTWPRCRSPCTRWTVISLAADRRKGRRRRRRAATARARRPRRGRAERASGRPGTPQFRCRAPARASGAHGDRLAEPVGLAGEVAAHLVGGQVGLAEQVADAGGGHRPALGRVLRVGGQHGQRDRLAALVGALHRAEQLGHVWAAGPGQHPVELDVGVDASDHPAEHLEDRRPVVDDAGVALLGVGHPGRRLQRQLGLRLAAEQQPADDGVLVDELQQRTRGRLGS